jgi:hypothetical protein
MASEGGVQQEQPGRGGGCRLFDFFFLLFHPKTLKHNLYDNTLVRGPGVAALRDGQPELSLVAVA